jgi:dihydroxyacetone kinase
VNEALLADLLAAAAGALEDAAPELNRLDAVAGDGDLGVTMTEVARIAREVLAAGAAGVPELLSALGAGIARGAPSTSGTLVATAFLRASRACGEGGEPTEVLARCFGAALDGVRARGKAEPGDRTLVDGLASVSASLEASAADGLAWQEALARAAEAARSTAQATAEMEPKKGRASWAPQRALGHPDAGCSMLAIVLSAAAARAGA